MRRIVLSLLIVTSLLVFFVLPNFLNICFPDGCIYNPQNQVCQDGSCFNEDIMSHLQEKSSFAVIVIKNILPLFYLIILGVLLFLFSNNKTQLLECHRKFKIISRHFSLDHNLLIFLFAKGILNPKIF
ncbi:MAG: hypothetical protein WCW17_04450 [Patescibacteria group bacterium]